MHHIKENTSPNVPLTLLGNKCDLKKEDDDHFLKAKVTVTCNLKVSITILITDSIIATHAELCR